MVFKYDDFLKFYKRWESKKGNSHKFPSLKQPTNDINYKKREIRLDPIKVGGGSPTYPGKFLRLRFTRNFANVRA